MGVSENSGFSSQIIHFNRVFHYKPSILGSPYFWKHPYYPIHECMILMVILVGEDTSPMNPIGINRMGFQIC